MSLAELLTVAGASKSYNGVPALIDASLHLLSGEVHALMGENGAGKSTLIKLLAGVVTPDRMQVWVRGRAVSLSSARAAFDLGLRFIHQELNVIPQLSVAENIFLSQSYPRLAGVFVDWRKLNADARSVLHMLGVTHLDPRTLAARLSTGDQMLLKIASAFLGAERTNAAIYVMDEPTAALSSGETEMLFAVINSLRKQGCAILYVSHRIDELFKIADRVTVMRDGRTVATMPLAETSPEKLITLMTGRDLQQVYPTRENATPASPLLEVRNLSTHAAKAITFTLHAGEIIGIAGLSGSGRTELLRALMGADRIRAGEIRLSGKRLSRYSTRGAWRYGFAFVPEERRTQGLVVSRTVADNVTLPHLGAISRGGILLDSLRAQSLSETLGASVRLRARGPDQIVRQLSGGNQQKIVFARALAGSPAVLLLDEPTRGVDMGAKVDLYRLIRQASARGVGVIIASSDLPELIGLCDRIMILQNGRLVDTVQAAGLTEAGLLTLCYGAEMHSAAG